MGYKSGINESYDTTWKPRESYFMKWPNVESDFHVTEAWIVKTRTVVPQELMLDPLGCYIIMIIAIDYACAIAFQRVCKFVGNYHI